MAQIVSYLASNWVILLAPIWATIPFAVKAAAKLPLALSRLRIRHRYKGHSSALLERRTLPSTLLGLHRDEELVFAALGLWLSQAEREAISDCVQKHPVSTSALRRAWPYIRLTSSGLAVHIRWYDYAVAAISAPLMLSNVAVGAVLFVECILSSFDEMFTQLALGTASASVAALLVWSDLVPLEAALDIQRRLKIRRPASKV